MISPFVAYLIDTCGTAISALSYLIMKTAHHKLEERDSHSEGVGELTVYGTKTWIIGFFCGVAGGIIHVVVLPYCDLVLLST